MTERNRVSEIEKRGRETKEKGVVCVREKGVCEREKIESMNAQKMRE